MTDDQVDEKVHDELKKYAEFATGLTPWPAGSSHTQPDVIAIETGWASFESQKRISRLTEELIRHNKKLANATVILAAATIVLASISFLSGIGALSWLGKAIGLG